MSEDRDSLHVRLETWREEGQLYLAIGIVSVLVAGLIPPVGMAGFLIPVTCLIGVFCGVRLYLMGAFKLAGLAIVLLAVGIGVFWVSLVTA